MRYIGSTASTAVIAWAAWRWMTLRSRTGADWLSEIELNPPAQTTARVAVIAVFISLIVTLWTPRPTRGAEYPGGIIVVLH